MYVEIDARSLFGRQLTSSDCDGAAGYQWYTCDNSKPPYKGCCAIDPCNEGCPDDKDQEKVQGGGGTGGNDGKDSTTTPNDTPTSTTEGPTAKTTSEGKPSPTTSVIIVTKTASDGRVETSSIVTTVTPALPNQTGVSDNGSAPSGSASGSKLSKGAVAGIAVGAGLAVSLLVLALFFLYRRKKREQRGRGPTYLSGPAFPSPTIPDIGVSEVPVGAVAGARAKTVDTSSTPGTLSSDPFAPFGGRYDPRATHNGPSRTSFVSSMGDTNTAQGSPTTGTAVSRNTLSVDGAANLMAGGMMPAQLDGEAIRPTLEMDASETSAARHQGHVSELDGAAGRQVAAVMELDGTPRNSPNSSHVMGSPPRSPGMGRGGDQGATLNVGRGQRDYVTSWSSYETEPGPAR